MFACFFFFQAEDGIRDHCVTGVQTCALPILSRHSNGIRVDRPRIPLLWRLTNRQGPPRVWPRSEERRVGKECRSRWEPYNLKENKTAMRANRRLWKTTEQTWTRGP